MDALERESRLWQARAAVGQDLDRLTAEAVALALDADPGQRARVAAANAASRLLLRLVDQVADSEARIEDVAALFSSRPFTWDFTGGGRRHAHRRGAAAPVRVVGSDAGRRRAHARQAARRFAVTPAHARKRW